MLSTSVVLLVLCILCNAFSNFAITDACLTSNSEKRSVPQERNMSEPWKIWTKNNKVDLFKEHEDWSSPWYFIQGADPQYGLIERYINKNPVPNWDKEIELTEKLVEKINSLNPKPKFFVICGDLCDAVSTTEPDLFISQEATFKRIFSKIDPSIPILVTCGNHDVGDSPTPESLEKYQNSWGDDYYSFWCGGILFLAINTQYFMDSQTFGLPNSVEQFAGTHKTWLEEQLNLAKSKDHTRVVMLQHIPWFLSSVNEPVNSYFTVSREVRDKMLDKLVDAGVQKVFCGHLHRNVGGTYKNMEVVVTSAIGGQLGSDVSGVRLVKVYKDKIEHQYYGIDDLPSSVEI